MTSTCDVLIVGGGPTGITLAALLAKRGVKVIVAEKEPDIHPLPRAAHIDDGGMRILQEAGAAIEVMATSRRADRYEFRNAKGRLLLGFKGAGKIGVGGWPVANMIHQPSVEAALRKALLSHSCAELRSGWDLTSFTQIADGVSAYFTTPAGSREIRARWMVGADGARSPVRKSCGIALEDLGFEQPWLVVDVLVDDASRLPSANLQICDPKRPTTCVLMGAGRHRWEFMILPGEAPDMMLEPRSVERLLTPWNVAGAVRIERTAVYTFRARIAQHWRKGRVFLAGDAAHQTPPFAGQGLCSGLRDAANLAWKLAAVVDGEASEDLLDTYQAERGPHLRATIDLAIMMGRMVCTTSRTTALLRDARFALARILDKRPNGGVTRRPIRTGAISPGMKAAGEYFPQIVSADGHRLDDALGSSAWLLESASPANGRIAPFRDAICKWLAERNVAAVLLRPDRYVFGAGEAEILLAHWQSIQRSCMTHDLQGSGIHGGEAFGEMISALQ